MDIDISKFKQALQSRISTDTRFIEKNDVFFAFKGEKFDGHDFLMEAFEKGARTFVVSDKAKIPSLLRSQARILEVKDTVTAYGDWAAYVRTQFKIPFVAVTGSVGKTTAKELVAHFLKCKYKVLHNRGTENNLIGVPKTLLQLDDTYEAAVLELGTNAPGEIERLASLVKPQVGILTQIGFCHLEGLGSVEGVKKEKLGLVPHIEHGGLLLLNGEDPRLADVQSSVHRVVRVGFSKPVCDVTAEQIEIHENGTSFKLNGKEHFETQLIGRHNLIHILFAIEVARHLGVELPAMQQSLASFKAVPGRLQIKKTNGLIFIDDSYNSNPTSFEAALETLKNMKVDGRKAVVCGDMLELGEHTEKLHRQLGQRLAQLKPSYIVTTGPNCKYLVDEATKAGYDAQRIFNTAHSMEAGQILKNQAQPGDVVLVKGSRGMAMEKVLTCC